MKYLPEEYVEDVLVRFAHHSSAIEGNSLSLPEAVSVILYNKVICDRTLDLHEIFEVKNHEEAFRHVLSELQNQESLSLSGIEKIHALVTDRLNQEEGGLKSSEMQQWGENVNSRLAAASDGREKIDIISKAHIEFERVHPFSNANGRTGRLLMNYLLLEQGFAPVVIPSEDKEVYFSCLVHQDFKKLSHLIEKSMESEEDRIARFSASEQQRL